MILGDNLILAINGTPLAASKSCSISKSQSFIEVSSPTSGRWQSFVPKNLGWSISSDCLIGTMDAYKTLDAAWKAGTPLTVRFYDTEYNENETGTAYIDKLDLNASKGSLAKMSVSLKGSGELSTYSVPITVGTSQQQSGKFYNLYSSGVAVASNYAETAKIYGGSFTLSKRTLVEISIGTQTYDYVFLSNSNGIVNKAHNADNLTPEDYSTVIKGSGRVWLNAGTWYVVESSQQYSGASYAAVS